MEMDVRIMADYLQQLIFDYERDIAGNVYTLVLSNGDIITFEIKKRNVPHLLGIGKLPLRQVQGKYASEIYRMIRQGKITLALVASTGNKEIYKKIMNFCHLIDILHCGDMVKVVKQIGSLNSSYLLYLDHQPTEIVHLGLAQDSVNNWYPESLLVLQRNVTAYIDNQIPVDIVSMTITSR